MHNQRPLTNKERVRLLVALTILAWATQTLLQQWGFGQTVVGTAPEKFVPDEAAMRGGTLELRSEATVIGGDVTLKQLCRWSDTDKDAFAAIENLVLLRIAPQAPYRTIALDEIKSTLHDAGVNLGRLRFVGATVCTVSRRDVDFNEGDALRQWVANKEAAPVVDAASAKATAPGPAAPTPPPGQPVNRVLASTGSTLRPIVAADPLPAAAVMDELPKITEIQTAENQPYRKLREVLVAELARQASVAPERLVVDFKPQDERLLNLVEPHFKFHATLKRGRALGTCSWEVLIDANGETRKATIGGTARCWQQQLVVTKPLAHRQVIREDDVLDRRTLVDQLDDTPLVAREQAVGQMAATELKPGVVLNARMVEAVPLAKTGQLVSVTIKQGGIEIKSVAKALEPGTFGQTIRVRNEATKDIFDVTLTGPQEAVMGDAGAPSTTDTNAKLAQMPID